MKRSQPAAAARLAHVLPGAALRRSPAPLTAVGHVARQVAGCLLGRRLGHVLTGGRGGRAAGERELRCKSLSYTLLTQLLRLCHVPKGGSACIASVSVSV